MKASRGRGKLAMNKRKGELENKWKKLLTIRCRETSSHLHVHCWIGWSMPFYTRDLPNCKICIIYKEKREEMETRNAAHNSAHHSACRNRKIRSGHETRTFTFHSYVDDNVMRKNLILVSTSDYLSTHENGIYNFSTRQGSEKLVNHRLRTAHRLDEIARLSSRSQLTVVWLFQAQFSLWCASYPHFITHGVLLFASVSQVSNSTSQHVTHIKISASFEIHFERRRSRGEQRIYVKIPHLFAHKQQWYVKKFITPSKFDVITLLLMKKIIVGAAKCKSRNPIMHGRTDYVYFLCKHV